MLHVPAPQLSRSMLGVLGATMHGWEKTWIKTGGVWTWSVCLYHLPIRTSQSAYS